MSVADIQEITLIGPTPADGSRAQVWDLLGGSQGLWLTDGLQGLHLPKFTNLYSTSAHQEGRTYQGTTWEGRDLLLQLTVGDRDPDPFTGRYRAGGAWRELKDRVWADLHPERLCRFQVRTETGGYRFVDARLGSAKDPASTEDPSIEGLCEYEVGLEVESAWWSGFDETADFVYRVAAQNYYGGDTGGGKATPFYLSPASDFASATISNPGDREAFVRYVATGPGVPVIGADGRQTALPRLAAGEVWTIDTGRNRVTDQDGRNCWPRMGQHDLRVPIPPGREVPLSIDFQDGLNNVSSIHVELTPQYREGT